MIHLALVIIAAMIIITLGIPLGIITLVYGIPIVIGGSLLLLIGATLSGVYGVGAAIWLGVLLIVGGLFTGFGLLALNGNYPSAPTADWACTAGIWLGRGVSGLIAFGGLVNFFGDAPIGGGLFLLALGGALLWALRGPAKVA